MSKQQVSPEVIEAFLQGKDPQKYIIAVESAYHVNEIYLVINDPVKGKYIETHTFNPFVWAKHEVSQLLFGGNRNEILKAMKKYSVRIKGLKTTDSEGFEPKRLANGYKYIIECKNSYNHLMNFFKEGGMNIYSEEHRGLFINLKLPEQYMIQTGKRLFKGFEDYNDLHRFQFDLETEGLDSKKDRIFQIGLKDNRGFEEVIEILGDTEQEIRDNERIAMAKFFKKIDDLKPDTITGYNSESFDWPFLEGRGDRLSVKIPDIGIGLNHDVKFKRKEKCSLKLGNDTEQYTQTLLWGYNVLDISHAVRRAQAINTDIKKWNLKYITKYSDIAKKNRVYVKGNIIHKTWNDKINDYAFNNKNGDWYIISEKKPLQENYKIVKGNYIVQRYLIDDLWETEQVDLIFNQASFLLAKIVPTMYWRSSTMGTAGTWSLIMQAWSYENGLAIPETESKRDFTGGLSRLLQVGYFKNIGKLDFAGLYPKSELTHDIFPDLDISNVMKGLLAYIVGNRDKYKVLAGKHKANYKALEKRIKAEKDTLSKEELIQLKEEHLKEKQLFGLYDKKQLPLKILANSWFGSYGAPYIFNWGETNCAEETTCRGRQYLRFMVKYFTEKFGCKALIMDTDGVNFAIPDSIKNYKYTPTGKHWKTEDVGGKELFGIEAALAEFNENHMFGWMGLDLDDIIESAINFRKKNYANKIDGKIKFVGNSIKSKKMPTYIEDFLDKGIKLLLDGKGHDFVEYYYEYVEQIYNYKIPLAKIASKSKVKLDIDGYRRKSLTKNKKGNAMPKQAHMELAIKDRLTLTLGDVLYYVNTGKSKSDGDIETVITNKITKKEQLKYEIENNKKYQFKAETQLNCKLIPAEQIENEPDLISEEYNVMKYVEAFNKKVAPLLVCFDPDMRDNILLKIKRDKKTKLEVLSERNYFTKQQCELVAGKPLKPEHQDDYVLDLMTMEDKEIKFWTSVDKIPNNIEESEWLTIKEDYIQRMIIAKEEGIKNEKLKLDNIIKRLEAKDIENISNHGVLPIEVLGVADLDENSKLISRKWKVELGEFNDLFKYENEANLRSQYYLTLDSKIKEEDRYETWLNYKSEQEIMTGKTFDVKLEIEVRYDDNERFYINQGVDKAIDEIRNNITSNIEMSEEVKNIIKIEEPKQEDDWLF